MEKESKNLSISDESEKKAKAISDIFKDIVSIIGTSNKELANFALTASNIVDICKNIKKVADFDKIKDSMIKNKKAVNDFSNEIGEKLKNSFQSVKGEFKDLTAAFKEGGTKEVFKNIGDEVKKFGGKVEESAGTAKNNFIGFFKDLKTKGLDTFGSLKTKSTSLWSTFKSNPFAPLAKAVTGFGTVAAGAFSVALVGGIVLAATAIAGFIEYFSQLMETNDEFREKVTTAWEGVKEAFQPAIDAFGELLACLVTGKESVDEQSGEISESFLTVAMGIIETITGVVTFFSDIVIGIVDFIKEILFSTSEDATGQTETTWDKIKTAFSDAWTFIEGVFQTAIDVISTVWELFGEDIIGIFSTVWTFISDIISGAVGIVSGIFDVIVGIFTGNGEKIKEGFKKIWSGIKGIFSGIGEFFSGIWDKVVSIFGKVGTKIGDAIGGAFKAVINAILGFAEDVINGFIKAINFAIKMINLIPGVNIKKLDLLVIPKLAGGGLVEPGQMFIARERGPELVGSFGSKTAVMNNNQIVEAVSRGVYNAVSSAMGSGGSYTFNINNQLDGREIGRQVIKYHNGIVKQTGVSPLLI